MSQYVNSQVEKFLRDPLYMEAPCTHLLLCLQHENRLAEAHSLYGWVWMTSTFAEAYSSVYGVEWLPPVTKDMLIESDCTAIVVE